MAKNIYICIYMYTGIYEKEAGGGWRRLVVQRQTPSPVSLTPRIHNLECVGRANID